MREPLLRTLLGPGAVVWLIVAAAVATAQESPANRGGAQETAVEGSAQEADPEAAESEAPFIGELPELSEDLSTEQMEALRLVGEILREQQLLLSSENFVYQSGGRRDPFRSLLLSIRQRELSAPISRPAGLPGFLINELTIKAVAQYQGRWHAMIIGLDRRTYFAEVGSELYDGRVVEINTSEVVFEQEVEDMLGARSTRKVIKRLRGDRG